MFKGLIATIVLTASVSSFASSFCIVDSKERDYSVISNGASQNECICAADVRKFKEDIRIRFKKCIDDDDRVCMTVGQKKFHNVEELKTEQAKLILEGKCKE